MRISAPWPATRVSSARSVLSPGKHLRSTVAVPRREVDEACGAHALEVGGDRREEGVASHEQAHVAAVDRGTEMAIGVWGEAVAVEPGDGAGEPLDAAVGREYECAGGELEGAAAGGRGEARRQRQPRRVAARGIGEPALEDRLRQRDRGRPRREQQRPERPRKADDAGAVDERDGRRERHAGDAGFERVERLQWHDRYVAAGGLDERGALEALGAYRVEQHERVAGGAARDARRTTAREPRLGERRRDRACRKPVQAGHHAALEGDRNDAVAEVGLLAGARAEADARRRGLVEAPVAEDPLHRGQRPRPAVPIDHTALRAQVERGLEL